jgi:CRP-like cAMP-binding protein
MLSTMERVLFLRSVDIFSDVAGEDLAPLAMVADEARFGRGETVLRSGDPGEELYVIVAGEIGVIAPTGEQIAQRGPGKVIGEMAVFSGRPRSATCVALSEVVALRLLREDVLEMLAERPALAVGMIQVLTERLDEATQLLALGGA